jgi:hypothetical protein
VPLAEEALIELLRRGERARLRGSTRAVQVDFIATGSPYWRLDYAQRQHCHVSLAAAERAGAVELRWARQGGDDRPLEKVRLVDVDRLAAHLGTTTVDATVREARALLDPWLDGVPRVAELVEAWSRLKSPVDSAAKVHPVSPMLCGYWTHCGRARATTRSSASSAAACSATASGSRHLPATSTC